MTGKVNGSQNNYLLIGHMGSIFRCHQTFWAVPEHDTNQEGPPCRHFGVLYVPPNDIPVYMIECIVGVSRENTIVAKNVQCPS